MLQQTINENERPPRLAWSLDEVSEAVSVSTGYLRKIISAGELNATRAGRRVLILDSDLREWLNRNRQAKAA